MILYHATTKRALRGIRQEGLLVDKTLGKLRAVWLHTASNRTWAMLHTVKRHGGRVEDVVILSVRVSRRSLRRWGRGLWACMRDVPVDRIIGTVGFQETAGGGVA